MSRWLQANHKRKAIIDVGYDIQKNVMDKLKEENKKEYPK